MPVRVIQPVSQMPLVIPERRRRGPDPSQLALMQLQQQGGAQQSQLMALLLSMLLQRQTGEAERGLRREELGIEKGLAESQLAESGRAARAQEGIQGQIHELGVTQQETARELGLRQASVQDVVAGIQEKQADQQQTILNLGANQPAFARLIAKGEFASEDLGEDIMTALGGRTAGIAEQQAEGGAAIARLLGRQNAAATKAIARINEGKDPTESQLSALRNAMRSTADEVFQRVAGGVVGGEDQTRMDAMIRAYQASLDELIATVGAFDGFGAEANQLRDAFEQVKDRIGFEPLADQMSMAALASKLKRTGRQGFQRAIDEVATFNLEDPEQFAGRAAGIDFGALAPEVDIPGLPGPATELSFPPGDLGPPATAPVDLSGLEDLLQAGAPEVSAPGGFLGVGRRAGGATQEAIGQAAGVAGRAAVGTPLGFLSGLLPDSGPPEEMRLGVLLGETDPAAVFEVLKRLQAESQERGVPFDALLKEEIARRRGQ